MSPAAVDTVDPGTPAWLTYISSLPANEQSQAILTIQKSGGFGEISEIAASGAALPESWKQIISTLQVEQLELLKRTLFVKNPEAVPIKPEEEVYPISQFDEFDETPVPEASVFRRPRSPNRNINTPQTG